MLRICKEIQRCSLGGVWPVFGGAGRRPSVAWRAQHMAKDRGSSAQILRRYVFAPVSPRPNAFPRPERLATVGDLAQFLIQTNQNDAKIQWASDSMVIDAALATGGAIHVQSQRSQVVYSLLAEYVRSPSLRQHAGGAGPPRKAGPRESSRSSIGQFGLEK